MPDWHQLVPALGAVGRKDDLLTEPQARWMCWTWLAAQATRQSRWQTSCRMRASRSQVSQRRVAVAESGNILQSGSFVVASAPGHATPVRIKDSSWQLADGRGPTDKPTAAAHRDCFPHLLLLHCWTWTPCQESDSAASCRPERQDGGRRKGAGCCCRPERQNRRSADGCAGPQRLAGTLVKSC